LRLHLYEGFQFQLDLFDGGFRHPLAQEADDPSENTPGKLVPSGLNCKAALVLATAICDVRDIPVGQACSTIPENAEPEWVEWD